MPDSSLINQYENFRSSVLAGINSLEIDEAQKQIFTISLQAFYLQMLRSIPVNSHPMIHPKIMN